MAWRDENGGNRCAPNGFVGGGVSGSVVEYSGHKAGWKMLCWCDRQRVGLVFWGVKEVGRRCLRLELLLVHRVREVLDRLRRGRR